ncbi:MAG: sigma-70 family RNA polymerase sigma factor [Bryobacteraceae bacterium]|nr:sigma-70 family RNA polymerase sigma factor [Bryobacteraceae bacterium]
MSEASPSPSWEDAALVQACLDGDQRAWEALLEKYKRLIYSVLVRYRLPEQDAADVFQAVCVDLWKELASLREVGALRGWLARVAANRCFHWKQRQTRHSHESVSESDIQDADGLPEWLAALERDQLVREATARLGQRCRDLVRMLFYEDPPRPYESIAAQLGLATGSIGFIRGRCLKKLAAELEASGL